MNVYINFVSISRVTSSCSMSLNVGIVICIVSSVGVCPVNKIALEKKNQTVQFTSLYKLPNVSYNPVQMRGTVHSYLKQALHTNVSLATSNSKNKKKHYS